MKALISALHSEPHQQMAGLLYEGGFSYQAKYLFLSKCLAIVKFSKNTQE